MRLSPKPLPINDFYILISLARGGSYGYQIIAMAYTFTRSGVILQPSSVYTRLKVLTEQGSVRRLESDKAPTSSRDRIRYELTKRGTIRLQAEYHRMKHALAVMDAAGLATKAPPADVDFLMADLNLN